MISTDFAKLAENEFNSFEIKMKTKNSIHF